MLLRNNIYLIGFSASGKSTCAPLLSGILKRHYIDLDKEVTNRVGKRQVHLFSEYGQDYYRALESRILKSIITDTDNQIIVTGGGTILLKDNRGLLKETGTIIYLRASPEIIAERIVNSLGAHDASQPLVNAMEMNKFLINIMKFREVFYLDIADVIISTSNLSPIEVVNLIIEKLKSHGQ